MERNIYIYIKGTLRTISHVCIYLLLNNEYHYQSVVNQTLHATVVSKKVFVIHCPNSTMRC